MDIKKLFSMQKELDSHIQAQHSLQGEDLVPRKILALLVELGELANETRCFKFWSLKASSPDEVLLEEFVDGIHFILSLGIEAGFDNQEIQTSIECPIASLNEQFMVVYHSILKYSQERSFSAYEQMFLQFIALASLLRFSAEQIERAYIKKNEVNYERQQKGY